MGLKHGLSGFAVTCLAVVSAAAQEDWQDSSTDSERWNQDAHEGAQHDGPRLSIHCLARNDFGYVAGAHGMLQLGSRTPSNTLTASGELELDAHFIEDAPNPRHVSLQGTIDLQGQYLFADVTWGADDLQSVFFAFGPGSMSYVRGKNSTEYQTECSTSVVKMPRSADLAITSKLTFTALAEGAQRAQLQVLNVGNATVTGPAARIRIAGQDVSGTLYDNMRTKNALDAGEQGYIELDLPAATLTRCGNYAVILDLDHALQSGELDPFANDSADADTPCLRWNTPITEAALGGPVDPKIAYQTLDNIVNSQVVVRADGNLCNACHYSGSSKPYSPPAGTITPWQQIGSRAWSGYDGWVYQFHNLPDTVKPVYLKQAFRRWLDDGGL